MLKTSRSHYFILTIAAIMLGALSRKIDGVPTFFGDLLYAIMVYFGMRMLFINSSFKKTIILAFAFCFGIEFLQLHDAEWMLTIRRTSFGHYVLGQDFLWSDLGYYTLGIVMAFLMDFNSIRKKERI